MENSIKYNDYSNRLKKYRIFVSSMIDKYINVPNIDTSYIVQGFCFVGDYTLITAYDGDKKNNSIIYVIDLNGDLVKIVTLDGKYHCGGIAYHKKSGSIYISGESGVNNGLSSYIKKYKFIDILNNDKVYASAKFEVDNSNILKSSISDKSSVAYLTIYKDDIYLGNFSVKKNGKIKKYKLDNNGNVILDSCVVMENICKKTQGVCVYKYNDEYYYLFSTSFGRIKDSIIYITKLCDNKFVIMKKVKFPVMAEQINIDEFGVVSIMFESSSLRFEGVKNRISDICFFDFRKLL